MNDDNASKRVFIKAAQWLFLLYLVIVPIVRPLHFRVRGILIPYSDLVFVLVLSLWVIALFRREALFRFSKSYAVFGLYAFALILSAAFSVDPLGSVVKLAGIGYLVALAIVTANFAADRSFADRMIYAWLVGSLIIAIGAVLGAVGFYLGYETPPSNYFLSHYGSLPEGAYPRVRSFFENANMMCNYLNVSVMMLAAAWSTRQLGHRLSLLLFGVILAASLLTISPGLGGIALSVGIFLGVHLSRKGIRWPVLTAALLAAGAFASTLVSSDTANTSSQISVGGITIEKSVRVLVWENALSRVGENPFFGRGVGTQAAEVRYRTVAGYDQVLQDAHNAWLNVLGEAGTVGLMAFAVLCWRLLSLCDFSGVDRYRLALSAAFVGAFLFQNLFGSFEDARHLWVLMGLMIAASEFNRGDGGSVF